MLLNTMRKNSLNFNQSNALRKKAKNLIPGGAHTYSKGDDQFPELSPGFIVRGKGVDVWDVDGNQFIDWGMGLRSVILGHAHPEIIDAVSKQLPFGSNFVRPSPIEIEVAEHLIDLIPCAEMIKFAKNGSDTTTAAVKLARAYTGRDIVIRCADQPFFSVDDWFIGNTVCDAGIPEVIKQLTYNFRYNDFESLQQLVRDFPGQIACIIMEAASTEAPNPGFLEAIRELTTREGIILIFDEMISGFRFHPKGAQFYYGVTPDLATFGKALANGFSVAALVGRRELLELGGLEHDKPRVFLLSTTNGAETHALAAALKSIELQKDGMVSEHIWKLGHLLIDGFNQIIKSFGLEHYLTMQGFGCSPYIQFLDHENKPDLRLRTLFLQEMIQEGILAPYIAISAAHTISHVEQFLEATQKIMPTLQKGIEGKCFDELIVGPYVKPVFRKFN
jgi:glutamate-1-semialdehyde 2,1-aminomutase